LLQVPEDSGSRPSSVGGGVSITENEDDDGKPLDFLTSILWQFSQKSLLGKDRVPI